MPPPPDHYREFMEDADVNVPGGTGLSFDEIYGLLDAASEREQDRIEKQLRRIDQQLERRDEIHERNVEDIQDELEDLEERLQFFGMETFYRPEDREREQRRLKERAAELREALRRERRNRWENMQRLRRERREVVRELEEVEDDELVGTYLDQV